MARPALSASRTAAVINLLSETPDRAFTMAEIVRETKINIASCHAVLTALSQSGFLTKLPKQRRFMLGPTLVTAGQAAMKAHPLIERAQRAAEELYDELKIPVMLATPVGNEVLALTSIADRSGRTGGMKTGQRRPLLPFATLLYVAWSSEAEIEKWIARAGVQDAALIDEWRQTIALIRKRGYQLTLLAPEDAATLSEMVNQMAMGHYENQSMGLITSSGQRLTQPENILPDERYEVAMIAAPIFADNETAPLGLSLGGFSERLSGAEIEQLAESLMRTCLRVMREHRAN